MTIFYKIDGWIHDSLGFNASKEYYWEWLLEECDLLGVLEIILCHPWFSWWGGLGMEFHLSLSWLFSRISHTSGCGFKWEWDLTCGIEGWQDTLCDARDKWPIVEIWWNSSESAFKCTKQLSSYFSICTWIMRLVSFVMTSSMALSNWSPIEETHLLNYISSRNLRHILTIIINKYSNLCHF